MTGEPALKTPPRGGITLSGRTIVALGLASLVGMTAFFWPFFAAPDSAAVAHAQDAPWVFAALLPVMLLVVMSQMSADFGASAKGVAMLGMLSALVAALRPLGAGHAGLEPFWFVIIIAGRALGPGFGFALGTVGIFSSALLTGGVGPWLPFQMIGAGWVGMGAGLLPQLRGRGEAVLLAGYGFIASIAYGFLLNAWFWPFMSGTGNELSFVAGDPITDNIARWIGFSLTTSLGYDLPRAILTTVLILAVGATLLRSIRRASRKANFAPRMTFAAAGGTTASERPGSQVPVGGGTA